MGRCVRFAAEAFISLGRRIDRWLRADPAFHPFYADDARRVSAIVRG